MFGAPIAGFPEPSELWHGTQFEIFLAASGGIGRAHAASREIHSGKQEQRHPQRDSTGFGIFEFTHAQSKRRWQVADISSWSNIEDKLKLEEKRISNSAVKRRKRYTYVCILGDWM